ncbi:MAG: GNAT family N-acetyltransferase [Actinobacteria bacterium]|nr:GNAT family N-acetyltransferase [Actinomycetota bacterium]
MTTPVFRHATTADVPEVVDLVQSAYRGDRSRAGWTTEADLVEGQRIDEPMLSELLARPRTIILLAEDSGLVACCELAMLDDSTTAYFGMLAVRPGLQSAGLGRSVLEEAERTVVAEWGATALQLVTIHVRSELIDWYGRRGFEPTGETHRFPYGDERYGRPTRDDLHLVSMKKSLVGPDQ